MDTPLPRPALEARIRACLKEAPIAALLGARQTGKTTLARLLAGRRRGTTTFDLERAADRAALSTPELTLGDCRGLVVIDEIQRLPGLFEALRPLADRPRRPATFLVLGSASPDLVRGVAETLAGRILFVHVGGFSLAEVGAGRQADLWLRGALPRAFLSTGRAAWERWMEAFVATFLERDVPTLGLRIPPSALRRFWTMLAHFHGQIWNASELARAMDVTPPTARHYLDVLDGMYMARVLPPWHENVGKRQVKSPKIYLRDSGLLHFLLGIGSAAELRSHPKRGASWEGFALEQALMRFGERDAYFWRTRRGAELDLLLLRRGRRFGFEFKCSDAPSMTQSAHIALNDLRLKRLWIVYPGTRRYPLRADVEALPLAELPKLALR